MKSEIYNALAALNRGAELQLESLTILEGEGKLASEYVEHQKQIIEETRCGINRGICNALQTSEAEDSYRFQQLRLETEARLKES